MGRWVGGSVGRWGRWVGGSQASRQFSALFPTPHRYGELRKGPIKPGGVHLSRGDHGQLKNLGLVTAK